MALLGYASGLISVCMAVAASLARAGGTDHVQYFSW